MTEIIIIEEDSIETERLRLLYACQKVVRAGIWMIRNGYGQLMMLPYRGPTGCWRFELHVRSNTNAVWFRYSASQGAGYLDNFTSVKLRRNVRVEKLANAILEGIPETRRQQCAGRVSEETARWLLELESVLESGLLPEAFHEFSDDLSICGTSSLKGESDKNMNPQPGYIPPGACN